MSMKRLIQQNLILPLIFLLSLGVYSSAGASVIWTLGPEAVVTKVGPTGQILSGQQFNLSNDLNVTQFEVFDDKIWGVRGDNQLVRYDLNGNYLGGSGLWGNATDLEVVGNQIWTLGPGGVVTKVLPTGQILSGQQFNLSNNLGITDFTVFSDTIWGVRGDNQLARYDLNGNYLGGSGLWGNATDVEVVGDQIWTLGPGGVVTKVLPTGQILSGQQFSLSNNLGITDFVVFNQTLWGVRGDNQLARYDLNGNYLGGSGLWGDATSLEVITPPAPVPLPAGFLLFGSGLIGLALVSRRKLITA